MNYEFKRHSSQVVGPRDYRVIRDALDPVSEKWSLLVVAVLDHRTMRLSEFRRQIDEISQRMLT